MHSYENPSFCWKKIRYGVAQRGDISVARHRRASVFKAPAGRHIRSPHRCKGLFMRGRRPLQGQRVFLGRGRATNRLALWATIRWAHTCRIGPVTRGLRPLQGHRVFLGGGLLPIDWPAGPQTLRHIRAGKAPAGRHIGSTRRADISAPNHSSIESRGL
jgi:hypothetical protein